MSATSASSTTNRLPISAVLILAILAGTSIGFLQNSAAQEAAPPVTIKTNNESVNVVVDWEPQEIEPAQNVRFTLEFQNPSSGENLSHVNYNFEIKDDAGSTVKSETDVHTHGGNDFQQVTFDKTGSFSLVVTILGLGLSQPFDTTRSGTATASLVVVPEFPIAPVVLAAATGLAIAAVRIQTRRHG